MVRGLSFALIFAFVLAFGLIGTASAHGQHIELKDNTWSTSTDVEAMIASGGARLDFDVTNDESSEQSLLYTVCYNGENGEVPLAAGVLKPKESISDKVFIHENGKYTLKLSALHATGTFSFTPNCLVHVQLTTKNLGCFPVPGNDFPFPVEDVDPSNN